MFFLGKILAAIVLPPGLFIALALISSLLAAKGRKKAAMILALISAVALYALSTTVFSNLLVHPLEDKYPPLSGRPVARAIVVLGGGYLESSPEYGGEGALSADSEKRAVYGLELSKALGLSLIYSGGGAYDSDSGGSGAAAAGRLWRSLGTASDRILLETESRDTKDNARGVAKLAGTGPYILVTSAMHMPRSILAFEKAGVQVTAAPTDYRGKRSSTTWSDFLPDAFALEQSRFALHEYLGLLYYSLTL
jgi:uncharacterized SAM-binding protein YcdF (DUF218 family)